MVFKFCAKTFFSYVVACCGLGGCYHSIKERNYWKKQEPEQGEIEQLLLVVLYQVFRSVQYSHLHVQPNIEGLPARTT